MTDRIEDDGYEPCIVSFIDILGFRQLLNDLKAREVEDRLRLLKNFTASEDEPATSMDQVRLASRAWAYSVSDAVVRVRVYDTQFNDGAFIWELLDLLHAQIELVNRGVLIRAGVTIGRAHVGYNGQGPAFGPAVAHAYEVESQEAVYPRILISDDALVRHRNDPRLWQDGNTWADEEAQLSTLVAVGEDGSTWLDYLRQHDLADDWGLYLTFLQSHARLVAEGLKAVGSPRVRRKYAWLARYHNVVVNELLDRIAEAPDFRQSIVAEFEVDPLDFLRSILVDAAALPSS